jgi:3-phytase
MTETFAGSPAWAIRLLVLAALAAGCSPTSTPPADGTAASPAVRIGAVLATDPVTDDPDDPAIWLHPTDRARSLVFGTNKVAAPNGALYVFGLDGLVRQTVTGIDRPNNVDVEYGVRLADATGDVVVLTERLQHRLRVFRIGADEGRVSNIGSVPVLEGTTGEASEPMGVALYKRPADGQLFAIVAPKTGPDGRYLWQYALDLSKAGHVSGRLVRRLGGFSGTGPTPDEAGEIEAIVVDDALGYVYYSDERHGIRKWHADPDHPDAGRELAVFGRTGYEADREGLAIYTTSDTAGYLVSVDQIEGGSVLRGYRREGAPGAPHDHSAVLFEARTAADATDGLEVTSAALPGWPNGIAIMMNSGPKNFLYFDWRDIVSSATRE